MSSRTGEITHDVAWARPPAIPGAMIQGYNGAALASRAQVGAWGKPFLMGFESATTRAYAGGDAGEADATFSCGVYDSWGYPRECGSWVCAADSPSTPDQYLANIEDYGYRYAVSMALNGRSAPILAYGNPAAVEAMCAGIRRAGLVALRWGVGTWGYGEGGGANQPPNDADVELLQSGNTPGLADGTDLNWLYAPVSVFAALGGPSAPTPPAPIQEDDMPYVGVHALPGDPATDHEAGLVDGGVIVHGFTGGQAQWGPYGLTMPSDALQFLADRPGAQPVVFNDLEWALIGVRTKATLISPAPDAGGDGTPCPPVPDLSGVKAAAQGLVDELAKV